jgi:hypothetical protein
MPHLLDTRGRNSKQGGYKGEDPAPLMKGEMEMKRTLLPFALMVLTKEQERRSLERGGEYQRLRKRDRTTRRP